MTDDFTKGLDEHQEYLWNRIAQIMDTNWFVVPFEQRPKLFNEGGVNWYIKELLDLVNSEAQLSAKEAHE